jgi:hypothetical protein
MAEKFGFDFWQGQRSLPSPVHPNVLWSTLSFLCNGHWELLPPALQRLGHETDCSTPCRAKVKNIWIYTSTPYVFMVRCTGMTYKNSSGCNLALTMITKTLPITKCSKVNTTTQKQDLFLSSGREVERYSVRSLRNSYLSPGWRLILSNGPN